MFDLQPAGRVQTINLIDDGYLMGTVPEQEVEVLVPRERRYYRLSGVAADLEYAFTVAAIRNVDPDIDLSGRISTTPRTAENRSYQPAQVPNITANIWGRPAADVAASVLLINNISSDTLISRDEKPNLILEWDRVQAEYAALETQAVAFNMSNAGGSPRNNLTVTFLALSNYLASLVGWNTRGTDTVINAVVFRNTWSAYYAAVGIAQTSLANYASSVALWGGVGSRPANLVALAGTEGIQNSLITIGANGALLNAGGGQVLIESIAPGLTATANTANTLATDATNDAIFSGVEKLRYRTAVAEWNSSVPAQVAQLNALGLTTQGTNLTNAFNTFKTYLGTVAYTTAVSTSIVRATFNTNSATFENALITAANALDAQAATTANWTNLAGTIPANVNNASVSIGANGALVNGGGGQVTIGGLGYLGSLRATQNSDGANMIPSPYALDRVELGGANPATISDNSAGGNGRQLLYGKRVVLVGAASYVIWEVGPPGAPVIAGETLYVGFATTIGGANITTDTVYSVIQWFGANGTYLNADTVVPSSTVTGSQVQAAPGAVFNSRGSVVVPSNAAFCRYYTARGAAAQGGYFVVAEPYLGRSELGADITSGISGEASIDIQFSDPTTAKDGQIPFNTNYRLIRNGVIIGSGVTWAVTLVSGTINATFSNPALGTLTINGVTTNSIIRISATYMGTVRVWDVSVTRTVDAAPPPSSGGTVATFTSITSSTTIAFGAANTVTKTVKTGSAGQIRYDVSLDYGYTSTTTVAAAQTCSGAFFYRVAGSGSFVQAHTEQTGSSTYNAQEFDDDGKPQGVVNFPGGLGYTITQTGLLANTDYEVYLDMKNSGTRSTSFTGSASATGL